MAKAKEQNYDLAFTHLQNNQNISAYNLFKDLAQAQKKINLLKAGLLYLLAGECRARQNKDNSEEISEAGKLFLDYAKKEDSYNVKSAYLFAAKCFLKIGNYNEAKRAYEKSKKLIPQVQDTSRPVVIVDDSQSVVLKLQGYLKQLGYNQTISYGTGKDAIKGCSKLIKESKNPIFLLDMGLPDIDGDEVANKILQEKPNSQIILITADEKSSKRVHKAISSGVTAFIQKPFTIADLKDAISAAESEFAAL
jgi:CheY-like chemotaxis protein